MSMQKITRRESKHDTELTDYEATRKEDRDSVARMRKYIGGRKVLTQELSPARLPCLLWIVVEAVEEHGGYKVENKEVTRQNILSYQSVTTACLYNWRKRIGRPPQVQSDPHAYHHGPTGFGDGRVAWTFLEPRDQVKARNDDNGKEQKSG